MFFEKEFTLIGIRDKRYERWGVYNYYREVNVVHFDDDDIWEDDDDWDDDDWDDDE